MKVVLMVSNSVIGKYFASRFSKEIKTSAVIIENKKQDKIKSFIKKLGKNPVLYPYRLLEIIYFVFDNRIMAKKINNYFSRFDLDIKSKIYRVNDINSEKTKVLIKTINPQLGAVVGTSIIKQETINLFSKCILNIHTGILPEYKGLRSEFWALYNKEYDNLGVTIIKIDNGIDTGNIAMQDKIKYEKFDDEFKLRCKNIMLGVKVMIKAVKNFSRLKFIKQKNGAYYSNPSMIKSILLKIRNPPA